VPVAALRLADDGDSYCRVVDPASGPIHVPIVELTSSGALLDTRLPFQVNDYIDVSLVLKGLTPRPLFAHVVQVEKEGVRLRWLHFDPSDEKKLGTIIVNFAEGRVSKEDARKPSVAPSPAAGNLVVPGLPASAPAGEVHQTRRVVRPSAVLTPFSRSPASDTPPAQPTISPAAKADPAANQSGRVGTRRVVRPTAVGDAPATSAAPAAKAPAGAELTPQRLVLPVTPAGEESGHHIVIAPTAKFEKMRDVNRPEPIPEDVDGQADKSANEDTGGKRISVIGSDGKMDIGASIRSQSKTVRASELAARHERVRVLNMGTIKGLIQEAVGEAVQHLTANIADGERKRLLEEAEAGFQERLKAFQAEKQGYEAQTKHLQAQLRMAQDLLEQERKRTITADQFTVSEAGLGEIEEKMKRVLAHAIESGNVSPELQEQLRVMIAHILDSERERIREQELAAQNSKIELLEKKVARLAGTLEETERQRDEAQELAQALEAQGGGLRNVMTAGIKDGDGAKQKKLALMKEILEINRKMREELGIALNTQPLPAAEPAPAPATVAAKPAVAKSAVAKSAVAKSAVAQAPPPAARPAPAAAAPAVAAPDPEPTDAGAAEMLVNPDDEMWEVQPIKARDEVEAAPTVKRISASDRGPPPLERKPAS